MAAVLLVQWKPVESDRSMAARLDVSSSTVGEAKRLLVGHGIIAKHDGMYYVAWDADNRGHRVGLWRGWCEATAVTLTVRRRSGLKLLRSVTVILKRHRWRSPARSSLGLSTGPDPCLSLLSMMKSGSWHSRLLLLLLRARSTCLVRLKSSMWGSALEDGGLAWLVRYWSGYAPN